jgi:hypothetical protein
MDVWIISHFEMIFQSYFLEYTIVYSWNPGTQVPSMADPGLGVDYDNIWYHQANCQENIWEFNSNSGLIELKKEKEILN